MTCAARLSACFFVVVTLGSVVPAVQAGLIDFDSIPGSSTPPASGTPLTNQYATLGVIFTGGSERFQAEPGQVVSAPNGMMNPFAGQLTRWEFTTAITRFEVVASSVGFAGIRVEAFDQAGSIVDSFTASFPERGTAAGFFDTIILETSSSPIVRIETSQLSASVVDLHLLDNAEFTPVPEPSQCTVMALMFGLFAIARSRRNSMDD